MTGAWGRWGADDEIGALNLVTDECTVRAVGQVRTGSTIALAQPLGPGTPTSPHRTAPARFMNRDAGDYASGARAPDGFKFAEDTVQFPTHVGTHVDALAHVWKEDTLYNGHSDSSTRSTRGAQRCGADKLRAVVTRGVLIDLVARHGTLPARAAISPDQLQEAVQGSAIKLEPGDAVLIRTGWAEAHGSSVEYFVNEPGISEEAARWLAAQDIAIVGADNYAIEQQDGASGFPAHLVLLRDHGVPLVENLQLGELAAELRSAGRSTFLFVLAPIPLVGSTAAPVNPLAVL